MVVVLPAPFGPEDRGDLPGRDGEREPVDRGDAAVSHHEVVHLDGGLAHPVSVGMPRWSPHQ